MIALLLVTMQFIVFQTIDGRDVHINPKHVVSVSETNEARDPSEKLLTDKVHCIINLSNGTHVSVADNCDVVRRRLEDAKRLGYEPMAARQPAVGTLWRLADPVHPDRHPRAARFREPHSLTRTRDRTLPRDP
jgi:hypothetical protein